MSLSSNGPTAEEQQAFEARSKVTGPALQDFCGRNKILLPNDRKPTIGIALSGGGWRAMLSSAAFLDGLSEIGLLDAVSYIAGLSGGSWCVYQLLLSESNHNPFHGPKKDNPWLAGKRFDANVHKYEGLIRMLNARQVDFAARTGGEGIITSALWKLVQLPAGDVTIPRVLFNDTMGDGYVERWANFLADDLLWWKAESTAGVKTTDIKFPALSDDPTLTNGTKPLLFCSAIATRLQSENEDPQENRTPQEKRRLYDWTEFSTFGSRHYTCVPPTADGSPGSPQTDRNGAPICWQVVPRGSIVGNLHWPKSGWPAGSDQKTWGTQQQRAVPISVPPQDPATLAPIGFIPLQAHHLMAICGSAFALDVNTLISKLPGPLSAVAGKFVGKDDKTNAVLGGTTIVPGMGQLRDAGLCFNVPFPALLANPSGRKVDILIVMDASEDAQGCKELDQAEQQGYYTVSKETRSFPGYPNFPAGSKVRIFTPADPNAGLPIIIYVMGKTDRPTTEVKVDKNSVLQDCDAIRTRVKTEFLTCLRTVLTALATKSITESLKQIADSSAAAAPPSLLLAAPQAAAVPAAAAAGEEEEEDEEQEEFTASPMDTAMKQLGRYAGSWLKSLFMLALQQPNVLHNPFRTLEAIEGFVSADSPIPADQKRQMSLVLQRKAVEALVGQGKCEAPFKLDPTNPIENLILTSDHLMGKLLLFVAQTGSAGKKDVSPTNVDNTVRFATDLFGAYYVAQNYGLPFLPPRADKLSGNGAGDSFKFSDFTTLNKDAIYVWLLLAWMCEGNATAASKVFEQLKSAVPKHIAAISPKLSAVFAEGISPADFSARENLTDLLGFETVIGAALTLQPQDPLHFLLPSVTGALTDALRTQLSPTIQLMLVEAAAHTDHQLIVNGTIASIVDPKDRQKALNLALAAAIAGNHRNLADNLRGQGAQFSVVDASALGHLPALRVLLDDPKNDNNTAAVDAAVQNRRPDSLRVLSLDKDNTPEFSAYIARQAIPSTTTAGTNVDSSNGTRKRSRTDE